ncbi:hypothetical protein ACFSFY_16030 [Sporosarcina siberiensis]|uniref:Uncharacterized protein n=1 Tax=Sporosarcina siberiensis TaxID=1365606 RepID=A0ABW4SIZ4_9BACL
MIIEFVGYNLNPELIAQLEKDPSRFLVGAEPPFLCGTNWPDSGISDVVEANKVPVREDFTHGYFLLVMEFT